MKFPYNLKLFQAENDLNQDIFNEIFKNAWKENTDLTIQNLFFNGDRHHGKAVDSLFIYGIDFMCRNEPAVMNKLAQLIPEYGDWNDLFVLLQYPECRNEAVSLSMGQINADINLIQERRPCSRFSIYMPDPSKEEGKVLMRAFHLNENDYERLRDILRQKADQTIIPSDFHMRYQTAVESEMLEVLKRYKRVAELLYI